MITCLLYYYIIVIYVLTINQRYVEVYIPGEQACTTFQHKFAGHSIFSPQRLQTNLSCWFRCHYHLSMHARAWQPGWICTEALECLRETYFRTMFYQIRMTLLSLHDSLRVFQQSIHSERCCCWFDLLWCCQGCTHTVEFALECFLMSKLLAEMTRIWYIYIYIVLFKLGYRLGFGNCTSILSCSLSWGGQF